ncbi:MAG: DUF309 domain-containing protein [Planctomycetes bacterium]|nr:DUF309 domain-containing protein [Planctomycetota bacterium]
MSAEPRPEERPFDPEQWTRDVDWLHALALFDEGRAFEAHEHFEARWRATDAPGPRSVLRALVQLCALEVALAEGRERGARSLAAKVALALEAEARGGASFAGLPLADVAAAARRRDAGGPPVRLVPAPETNTETGPGTDAAARARAGGRTQRAPTLHAMPAPRYHVDPDITRAATLPGAFYSDTEAFERAKERVFAPSWQYALDERELAEPGAQRPLVLLPGLLDEPLAFVRDERGELACLSNTCTHRANLVVTEPCHARALVCRYHGRRFGLDGAFQSMPKFEGVQSFPTRADNLARVPHARLGPLTFASLAPERDFERWIAPVRERVGWLPLHEFHAAPERSRDYEFAAHWALYCDNYLEGFHIPSLHGGLNSVIEFESYTTELFELGTLQIARSKPGEPAFELPTSAREHGERIGAYYYWLWPNLMLNFYPWGLSLNHVQPLGPSRTRVAFRTWVWKPEQLDRGAGSGLHTVELEDECAVAAVQRGVRSRYYTAGRFSPEQETGVHHFHRLLAERLG